MELSLRGAPGSLAVPQNEHILIEPRDRSFPHFLSHCSCEHQFSPTSLWFLFVNLSYQGSRSRCATPTDTPSLISAPGGAQAERRRQHSAARSRRYRVTGNGLPSAGRFVRAVLAAHWPFILERWGMEIVSFMW